MSNEMKLIYDCYVYPSGEPTIFVEDCDKYGGAHYYKFKNCIGFNEGKTQYDESYQNIQFIKKNEDGTVTPGVQSEQLVLAVLDRLEKFNNIYPHSSNQKQIDGLYMYLEGCRERIDERISRDVMGKLEK